MMFMIIETICSASEFILFPVHIDLLGYKGAAVEIRGVITCAKVKEKIP